MKLSTQGLCTMLALLLLACTNQGMDELEHFGTKPKTNNTVISLEGLSFSLENEGELRYLRQDYGIELTKNSKGQIVPFPTFRDGQRLPLTVAIANRENTDHAYLVTSATYHAASKRLLIDNGEYKLSDYATGKTIDSPDSLYFTAGQSYYICAVLGGSPIHSVKPGMEEQARNPETDQIPEDVYGTYNFDMTREMDSDESLSLWDVRFEYNDILDPVQWQVGEQLNMTIPYATPWTELKVTEVVNAAAGDHRVVRFTHKDLKFKPMGHIFVLQIGNLTNQDIQVDGISFFGSLGLGGVITLGYNPSFPAFLNKRPSIYAGRYSEFLYNTDPDGLLRPDRDEYPDLYLSNKPILKAQQRKQYTYVFWGLPMFYNGYFEAKFVNNNKRLPGNIEVSDKFGSYNDSSNALRFNNLRDSGIGKVYHLELNYTNKLR